MIWRKYHWLLSGLGVSYLGNWVYLVALNVYVLNLTHSPGAVAGIYIVGPTAKILTSFIAGSLIDRMDKQKLMVWADLLRGFLILLIPFMDSITSIYVLFFIANVAGSFFGPSSTYYITKHIPNEERQRFNAILGTFNSGSFLLGPALAGLIILFYSTDAAIWLNSLTFFICALIISRLPEVEDEERLKGNPITVAAIGKDFIEVWRFLGGNRSFAVFYVGFQMTLMIAFALDSQEVTFIKQNLGASDSLYGIIVALTGGGAIVGGIAAASLTEKLSVKAYIGFGLFFTMFFYTVFYATNVLWLGIASFILLGFVMSFCNTGYETYYQQNVPAHLMGRFGSAATIVFGSIQILFTFLLGLFAEIFSLQVTAVIMAVFSVVLAGGVWIQLYSMKAVRKAT